MICSTKILFLAILTLTIANTQEIHCNLPLKIIPTGYHTTDGEHMSLSIQSNSLVGVWTNAQENQRAVIRFGQWDSNNGNLKIAVVSAINSSITAIPSDHSKGVITGKFDQNTYVFAQKDDASSYFNIEIRAKGGMEQSIFLIQLGVTGYNGKESCDLLCDKEKGVEFFKQSDGTYIYNQFVCFSHKLLPSLFLLALISIIF